MKSLNKGIFLAIPLLLLLVGVAIGYHYFFEKYEYPRFKSFQNIEFEQVSLQPKLQLKFRADAVFHNPASFGIDISGLYCEIFVDGKKTTTVRQELSQKMPPNADFSLPLQFEIPLSNGNLINDLGQILSGAWKQKAIHIRTKGTLSVTVVQLSMDLPFEQEAIYRLADYLK